MSRIIIIIIIFNCIILAQNYNINSEVKYDTLAGSLPALVKAQKRPYIVISNIEVPPLKTVTIEPGTILLFKNFAGLHVRGRLIAHASKDCPILFTSEYDKTCNPDSKRNANPFDWDGIYMTSGAFGSQLSYCDIKYSVYGLLSDTKLIRLDPVMFTDNGKNYISIENEEFLIENDTFRHVLEKNDPILKNVAIDLIKDPLYPKRITLRTGSIVGSLGGLCLTIVSIYSFTKSERELRNISKADFLTLNRNNGSKLWTSIKKERTLSILCSSGGIVLTTLCVSGIKWSYSF